MDRFGHEHGCCSARGNSRRNFLKLATLGAGVSLLTPMAPRKAAAGGSIEALLLSCMDFRLMDEVAAYMKGRNLKHNYDHIVLAGASLGALIDKKASWTETFWDHVAVAKQLHGIKKVMVMDHRDCGAYRTFLGLDLYKYREQETEVHTKYLRQLALQIKEKHPDMTVEALLMSLDGSVDAIAI